MVRPKRFELLAYRFVACCSIQLSYERTNIICEKNGAPEEIRTPGLQVRSLLLYPAELRAHKYNMRKKMVRPKRFELLAYRFVACCSIQLSYERT